MKSTADNLALWEQRITERARIGMTIVDWCNKNGLSKHQYHYWNKRIREKRKAGEETVFADVSPILSMNDMARKNTGSSSDFQIFFKGMQVTIPDTFNEAALAGLLKVLQKL